MGASCDDGGDFMCHTNVAEWSPCPPQKLCSKIMAKKPASFFFYARALAPAPSLKWFLGDAVERSERMDCKRPRWDESGARAEPGRQDPTHSLVAGLFFFFALAILLVQLFVISNTVCFFLPAANLRPSLSGGGGHLYDLGSHLCGGLGWVSD